MVVKGDVNESKGVDGNEQAGTAINRLAANIAACILETLFFIPFSCNILDGAWAEGVSNGIVGFADSDRPGIVQDGAVLTPRENGGITSLAIELEMIPA